MACARWDIQCEEMGLPYRFETVSFPPSAAYLALNPLGSVPFLEDDGGAAGLPRALAAHS